MQVFLPHAELDSQALSTQDAVVPSLAVPDTACRKRHPPLWGRQGRSKHSWHSSAVAAVLELAVSFQALLVPQRYSSQRSSDSSVAISD